MEIIKNINYIIATFYITNLNFISLCISLYSFYILSFLPIIKLFLLFICAQEIIMINEYYLYWKQKHILTIIQLILFYSWFAIFDNNQQFIICLLSIIKYIFLIKINKY